MKHTMSESDEQWLRDHGATKPHDDLSAGYEMLPITKLPSHNLGWLGWGLAVLLILGIAVIWGWAR